MNIESIRQEIYETANCADSGLHRTEAIFRSLAGTVAEAGFLTDPQFTPIRFKSGRQQCAIDGYDIDEEDGVITVFTVIDAHAATELDRPWADATCAKKDLDQAVKEMVAAIEAIGSGTRPPLDESDPAQDLVKSLQTDYRAEQGRVTCCVLTTGRVTNMGADSAAEAAIRTAVWDADRLIRTRENGREQLVADFEPIGGLPCLVSEHEAAEIQEGRVGVLIAKVPGTFLASLYNEHRMRLLERNVRAFLQFTGKVNKGIRETIRFKPEHFLSFNNGIAVTASKVRLSKSPGGYLLLVAEDFQIVNGGQTTASLARCVREDKADVSAIAVAMKLTVVPEELIGELVPLISRYANTQNRIQETDFFANNPWHIELERHSRAVEAERDELSEGRPIRWYYERVRGQYAEELAKLSTAPRKAAFRSRNPSRAKFTKTDLARYLLAWEQEAHTVSLGGQKCFVRLMAVLGATATNAEASQLPGEEEFRRICCLALLQRRGEKICTELGIVGYRANLVAYAIMVLSIQTMKRLPWRKIWTSQAVPPDIDQALRIAIPACDMAIRESAGPRNVSEWAKKPDCRQFVLDRKIELTLRPSIDWDQFSIKDMARPKGEIDLIRVFCKLNAEQWLSVANAARRGGANPVWSGVAETMANRLIPAGRSPSEKQTKVLRKVLTRYSGIAALRKVLSNEDQRILSGGS
ncbi:MAG: hypothetical protein JWN94_1915 [Betaproteobacteria bacterium]|nr:hypothetical protein [Betaproteobacteria bacterium]